ncbi:hypothetical protein FKW77_008415 [Venturia effusa]|uniref:HMG box domain-containing protein n=1 Tax=Venturia effusa TaxID=50376 RepID=A0A517L5Y0_9PEZI|nr:hypothetical protein FKW77_008415 [Venturia effusa]
MAREPKAAPHGFISVEEFIRTRDSVVTGLTSLTGGIHSLITAYINHSNQLLSGQGAEAESLDTAAINQFFVTGGIPTHGGLAGAALGPLKKEKKKRVKKEKDPDAPKRPLTAFFLFSTNARELVKRENPDSTPVEVNNEILRRWNQMDDTEKQRWKDLYSKNNEQYKKDVEHYKAVKGDDAVIEPAAEEEDMEEELVAPEDEDEEEEEEEEPAPPAVAESTDSASDDSEAEPVREPTPPVVKKGKTAAKRKGAKENGQAALAALAANSPSPSIQLHKEVAIPLPEEAPTSSKRKKTVAAKEESPEEPKKKKTRKGTRQEETVEVAPPTVEKTKKKKRKSEGF